MLISTVFVLLSGVDGRRRQPIYTSATLVHSSFGCDNRQVDHVDLNLIEALDALLAESSVTKAAARLHTSAPAMSRALARLRRAFDDPLARACRPRSRAHAPGPGAAR